MMRVRQKLALNLFPLIILFSLTANALASCPSMQQGPPCLEFGRTEAVFIGVATRVVHTPNTTELGMGPYAATTAYFVIEEAFKGVSGAAIVFNLDHCGYLFKENERYLVYAHRNHNKELDVRAGNTRTRLLSEAREDLEYIRGLATADPGSRVFGKVMLHENNLQENRDKPVLLQDVKVTLEGNNQRQEVVTDSEGKYEFKNMPAGSYRLRIEISAYLHNEERPLKLNGRGCMPVDFNLAPKGQIAGRVFDINGKPLDSVPVSLVPADAPLEQIDKKKWTMGFTNHEGHFSFSRLAPGRYLVIINQLESDKSTGSVITRALPRLFYPGVNDLGGAEVIVVGKDPVPREINFQLPVQ